jgi:hypothetical protein
MDPVSIKSCNDSTELILSVKSSNSHETRFIAEIRGAQFNGAIEASTYFSGPPSLLFKELAEKWDGWDGEIAWGAIDGELYFSATTNSLGSIILKVRMVYLSGDFELLATVALEAGQLDTIMRKVTKLYEPLAR